jgi:hypothetical protein
VDRNVSWVRIPRLPPFFLERIQPFLSRLLW